jgi:hypothetical protein
MNGQCKLCLKRNVELQRSHFIPAAAFKLLMDDGWKNPRPFLINNKTVVQTNYQPTARLLCRACEQLFHKNGESWFFKHCLRKTTFLIQEILAGHTPVATDSYDTDVFHAEQIPQISIPALAYFAASIFWRGAIHPWVENTICPVKFGPYEESFRRYLNGESEFPHNAYLQVAVMKGRGQYDRYTSEPCGQRKDFGHMFKFTLGGMSFRLQVGKNVPDFLRRLCFVRGPGNTIISTTLLDKWIEEEAVRKITSSPRLLEAWKRLR